jgi:hypothetical protein
MNLSIRTKPNISNEKIRIFSFDEMEYVSQFWRL